MSKQNSTVYVGNLPGDISKREIEDLFCKYGPIADIDLKVPPRRSCFCFLEFEDPRDAEEAVESRDGYKFDGQRLRVEMSRGGGGGGGPSSSSSHDMHGNSDSYPYRGDGTHSRVKYRVLVYGLPSSASWQDLKDHMRRAGEVSYAQVYRERDSLVGVVDYTKRADLKYAIRNLDDTEFRNRYSRAYISVREDRRDCGRSCSRSPSPRYSRNGRSSRSLSRSRQYSRERSLSRSSSKSRLHSRSLSHSRSPTMRPRSRSDSRSLSRSPMSARYRGRSYSAPPSRPGSRFSSRTYSRSRYPSRLRSRSSSFSSRSRSRSGRDSRSPSRDRM